MIPDRDHADWLAHLQVGDPCLFHFSLGARLAKIHAIGADRIWIRWCTLEGYGMLSWVHRDTGNCPAARSFITPHDVLPAIGADPDRPDNRLGGWEAA